MKADNITNNNWLIKIGTLFRDIALAHQYTLRNDQNGVFFGLKSNFADGIWIVAHSDIEWKK